MADSGLAGPLRIEEAMSANTRFPGLQGLAPNGLMDHHLANPPSSSWPGTVLLHRQSDGMGR